MKIILKFIRLLFFTLSIFFSYLSISRLQFTYVNGKYFDEKSSLVYSEDALLVYYFFAVMSVAIVIVISVFLRKNKNNPTIFKSNKS